MPNSTVPAADTGLPNLNRRSALAKLGMGIAGGASLATGASAETPVSHELNRLIEGHRVAHAALQIIIARKGEAEAVYQTMRWKGPLPVKGHAKSVPLTLDMGIEKCRKELAAGLEFSGMMFEILMSRASPKLQKRGKNFAKAVEEENKGILEKIFADDDAARERSGLKSLDLDNDRADDAEQDALMALCAYRCTTPHEALSRLQYLASHDPETRTVDHVGVLFEATRDVET